MIIVRMLAIALSVAAVAGCNPSTPAPAASSDTPAAVTAPAAAPQAVPVVANTAVVSEGGMLTVDPAVVDACTHPDNLAAVNVTWDATAAGTEGIQIFLQDAAGAKKLWSAAGAKGSQETGQWMADGSQVILVNGADSRELGRVGIKFTPCAN